MPSRPSWTAGEPGRFVAASAAGAGLALFLFTLVLTRGRADLVQWQRSGGFYDAQAHAWLAGNWEIPDHVLTIEKFLHDGRAYMYQGPWPALLRLPIVAVTSRFDGRLTQLSMVLATLVAMVGTAHLHWQVRRLLRPDSPVRRPDLLVAALATFVVGGGSALLYEASRAWVYHEAALWGAAWTIVAISVVLSCTQRPSRGRFAWAALVTTLAACSRLSVAVGAVAALGILTGGNLLARWVRRRGEASGGLGRLRWAASAPRADGTLPVLAPGLAAFVPVAVYATVNYIKFGTLFSIPFWSQGFTLQDEQRRQFLAVNDGTLFGMKWVPTTVVQYTRPDALRFTSQFPFVDFPPAPRPFSGVVFDLADYSSSLPSSMPLLAVLAAVGIFVLLRTRGGPSGTGVSALRGPTLGAIAGGLTILPFALHRQPVPRRRGSGARHRQPRRRPRHPGAHVTRGPGPPALGDTAVGGAGRPARRGRVDQPLVGADLRSALQLGREGRRRRGLRRHPLRRPPGDGARPAHPPAARRGPAPRRAPRRDRHLRRLRGHVPRGRDADQRGQAAPVEPARAIGGRGALPPHHHVPGRGARHPPAAAHLHQSRRRRAGPRRVDGRRRRPVHLPGPGRWVQQPGAVPARPIAPTRSIS